MAVTTQRLTYEDYLELSEMEGRYDIIDGEMFMWPGPGFNHQWIQQNVQIILYNHVMSNRLGVVLAAPFDILIQRDPLRVRQPDVLYLSQERVDELGGLAKLRKIQTLKRAPDLTVEILSPSNTHLDVAGKMEDYARIGVQECWIVSPEAETVEVLRLAQGKMERAGLYGAGEEFRPEMLGGLVVKVDAIFA
jgi:Uma2 family endonuclease